MNMKRFTTEQLEGKLEAAVHNSKNHPLEYGRAGFAALAAKIKAELLKRAVAA